MLGASMAHANLDHVPVSFGPVGRLQRFGLAVFCPENKEVMIRLGGFYDTDKEAIKAVTEKYGAKSAYVAMIKAAVKQVKEYEKGNRDD
jgi:hypothetical protein